MTGLRRGFPAGLGACLAAALAAAGLTAVSGPGAAAAAAAPPTVSLRLLLVGEGSADPTTAAWQAALTSEGVPYTLVTAAGTAPNETVNLPALSSGGTGNSTVSSSPTPRRTTPPGNWPPWTVGASVAGTAVVSAAGAAGSGCPEPRKW